MRTKTRRGATRALAAARGAARTTPVMRPALLALAALAGPVAAQTAAQDRYGFADFEIYELGAGVTNLRTGDVDGDGLADLVVVNPGRARIDMLVRLDPDAPSWYDESERSTDPNPIEYDGRFEVRQRPEERRVLALDVGDFDGDGVDDLAYATDTGELVVVHNAKGEGGERVDTRRIDALRAGCTLLVAGDLDGDGLDDVLFVGDGALVRVLSRGDRWEEPETIDRMEDGVDGIHLSDLDGDGHADLLYVFEGEDYPFRLRLGLGNGDLGPRTELDLPDVRASHSVDLDGDGRDEVLCVFQASGRVAALTLAPLREGRRNLARYPLGERKSSDDTLGFAVGDLDGDGVADLVVTDPKSARVSVHAGGRTAETGGRELAARHFPTLVGAGDPRIADVDADGKAELVVFSGPEKMIGVARPDGGRLPFPTTTAVEGEPVAMDVADMNGDGIDDVVLFATKGEARSREYFLHVLFGSRDGLSRVAVTHELEGFKKAPSAIRAVDLDRNGATDVVAFPADSRSTPVMLFQREGKFTSDDRGEDAPGLGILTGAGPRAMAYGDCDGDGAREVLVCSDNFARSMVFDAEDSGRAQPRVLEQFNGPAPDSAIESCAILDLDGDGTTEVVLFDGKTRELLVLERDAEGGTRVRERVEAGRIRIGALAAADLDGDGASDLIALAPEQFGVLYANRTDVTLTEAAFHEPRRARVFVHELGSADLDADGLPDVVACEASRNAILVLSPDPDDASVLEHRLGFKVFDEKTFSNRGSSQEPRELVAADFSADGKDDLAVLVHDKLILYVQE